MSLAQVVLTIGSIVCQKF